MKGTTGAQGGKTAKARAGRPGTAANRARAPGNGPSVKARTGRPNARSKKQREGAAGSAAQRKRAATAKTPRPATKSESPSARLGTGVSPSARTSKGGSRSARPQSKGPAPAKAGLTYAATGVDIQREDSAVHALAGRVNFQRSGFGKPIGAIGHFAGLIDFGADDALVLCTDGVGSKIEVANALRKWDTVGIDCVAMNVNDCICVGAEPLAFVDYLAVEDPDPALTAQLGIGLNEGCRQGGCSLIGGETASLPGIVKGFDIAGTVLGHVKKAAIVDGSRIQPGDVLIGLASSGIHSNGYSLARRAVEAHGHKYTARWPFPDAVYKGKSIGEVLLEPTRIYVQEVLALLRSGIPVHGLSHVTGSGLRKIRRVNQNVSYHITDPLPVPPVFERIQELGAVADHEMYKTFNMGMGFVVIVPKAAAAKAVKLLRSLVDYEVKVVGAVRTGTGVHHPIGGMH